MHASTVKRWCNDDVLGVEVTEGGHRRVPLRSGLQVAQAGGHETFLQPFTAEEGRVWHAVRDAVSHSNFGTVQELAMEWLVQGKTGRMVALFSHLGTRPDLPLATLFDEGIRGFMQQVGVAWTEGTLRVSDEHVATQCLVDALHGARAVRAAGRPVATECDRSEEPPLLALAREADLVPLAFGGGAVESCRTPADVPQGGGRFDPAPEEHPFHALENFCSSGEFARWMANGFIRPGEGGTA